MFDQNQLTPEMYQDGLTSLNETQLHLSRANCAPSSSSPYQEPWYNGPPLFTNYTQLEIPIYLLNCNFSTDPKCELPNTIYIPPHGQPKSPIIHKLISQIIGKNGIGLKYITAQTGLHYIWFNNTDKESWGVFELWGERERLSYASFLLNKRILQMIQNYNINLS
jgi:hypothetical protein